MDVRADLDRAVALMGVAQYEEAARLLQGVVARDASNFAAWTNLSGALAQLSRFDEAIAAADAALELQPGDARALNNKALALNALNRPAEALVAFDAALAAKPDHANAWMNRGAALQALGRVEEGLASIDRSIELNSNNADAYYYGGVGLVTLNRRDEAIASFDRAIALNPAPDNLYSKGVALLAFGRWREAWPLFEQRWQARRVRAPQRRDQTEPQWRGEKLDGVLRIWAEQGVGDQILFGSLLPLAHARAERIVLECDPRLAPLFRRAFPWLESASSTNAQCAMGGLGAALDVTPEVGSNCSPYLVADPAQRTAARARYEALAQGRPIIGISWFSENAEFGRYKSSALDEWAPLLTKGAFFVNLQYHAKPDEIAAAQAKFGASIHTDPHVDQVTDLDAFAAQIAAVDRVISVSNSGVHMAGALGIPCDVLAPPGRGLLWYWGTEGETTPWYPSVRIVRRAPGEPIARAIERVAVQI